MFLEAWSAGAILLLADFACRSIISPPSLPFLDAFGRDEDVGRKDSFFSINDITGREESVCDRRNEGTFLESIGRFRGKNWINP